MLLAGLYDSVVLEGTSDPLFTFTIVTTSASSSLSFLHDRMPLILRSPTQIAQWLDTSKQEWTPTLAKLVKPYSIPALTPLSKSKFGREDGLECYAVPPEVGKVGTESPTFIEPVNKRRDGIEAMFSRAAKKQTETKPKSNDIGSWEGPVGRGESEASIEIEERQLRKRERERDSSVEILDGPPPAKLRKQPISKTDSPSFTNSVKVTSFFERK
jgi:hypothetical protein